MRILGLCCLLALAACASQDDAVPPDLSALKLTPEASERLGSRRIVFGHQSVGANLIDGMGEVAPEFRVEEMDASGVPQEVGLAHMRIGRNGDPASKDAAFLKATASLGDGDIAFYKYCYLDMGSDTDVEELQANYLKTLRSARERGVRVFAVTMPLTAPAPGWKSLAKRILGKTTELELNAKRLEFNEALRKSDFPLLDLARFESTLEDGTRSRVQDVEVLPRAFTDDGTHLNARGRRSVASQFLKSLANALDD